MVIVHAVRRTGWLMGLTACLLAADPLAAQEAFTDSAGRSIPLSGAVERVFPAGPPASVIVYTLAPDRLLGWTRAIGPSERPFLPDRYADLPELCWACRSRGNGLPDTLRRRWPRFGGGWTPSRPTGG